VQHNRLLILKAKNERSKFLFQLQMQLSKFHTRDTNVNNGLFVSCKANHILQNVFQKDFSFTNWSFFQNLK